MYPVFTAIRQWSNKALLAVGRVLYKLSLGLFPTSMFSMTVDSGHLKTDVRIVSEDEDSVTIAKFDEGGRIKDGNFKILSTTDLHLGDDPKLRKKAFQLLANHICQSKPDLIVFTGDIILSKFQQIDAIEFAQFMEKIGVYWTIVFGNHEAREEKGFFKYLLLKSVSDYKHCLAKFGPGELFGYGNYCINILNSETSLQQSLFMFDSGRDILDEYRGQYDIPADMGGYDFLKKEQIDWYRGKIASLREKYGDFKSLMYMHIPLKEYEHAIRQKEDGTFEFTDECKILYGSAHESVGCSAYNSGMFDAILEEKSTQAVFSGHDHVNDFCAVYKGIYLVYNQPCGYETYHMGTNFGWEENRWKQGVTITLIDAKGEIKLAQRFNSMYLKKQPQKQQ